MKKRGEERRDKRKVEKGEETGVEQSRMKRKRERGGERVGCTNGDLT